MPLDFAERKRNSKETRRIYVGECGDICVETKHTRQTFSPEEFIALLRTLAMKDNRRILPAIQRFGEVKRICALVLLLAAFWLMPGCAATASNRTADKTERIVAVGGSVTEIVYALDAERALVGTDTSSVYPEAATKLPQVGYQHTLSAEGVISLKPTLLIVLPEAGPPTAIEQIESAGIKVLRVANESTLDGTKTKIRQIAEALNKKEKGEAVIKKLESD